MKLKLPSLWPSVLSADFSNLGASLLPLTKSPIGGFHIDVMDGHFVPNITYGPWICRVIERICPDTPLDVHLMIENPEAYIEAFALPGVAAITVHQEACPQLHRVIQQIRQADKLAGVALNPATSVLTLESLLGEIDLVLIMTVNPGFGGQKFLPFTLDKIRKLAEWRDQHHFEFVIFVDGGIDENTLPLCRQAGAQGFVAGNAVFGAADPLATIETLSRIIA